MQGDDSTTEKGSEVTLVRLLATDLLSREEMR